jgi:Ribbon-helix-helix protein, copG family
MARPRKGEEKDRAGRVSFRIPVPLDEVLRSIAAARELPVSDVVVEALERYARAEAGKAARKR